MPKSLYTRFLEIFSKIANLPPDETMLNLLKTLAHLLNGSRVLYAHHFEDQKTIKAYPIAFGIEKDELLRLFRFSLSRKSALKIALTNKDIYFTNDALNDPFLIKEFVIAFEVERIMIIPVLTPEGKLFGAMYVDSMKPFNEKKDKYRENMV